jgi:hypothetical protein
LIASVMAYVRISVPNRNSPRMRVIDVLFR